jgi:hypothetical protein
MSNNHDQFNEEFLSLSPPIVPWHQITSLSIGQPFNSTHLHLLFSQMTNIRILELHYISKFSYRSDLKEETLIDLLNDASLSNMLMSNGLRQLNLFTAYKQPNLINIAYSIVKRLPHLHVIELHGIGCQLIGMIHILINGLSKLSFLTLNGNHPCHDDGKLYEEKLRNLQTSNTRSFQTEVPNTMYEKSLFVWL